MIRTQVQLTEEQSISLKRLSAEKGKPVAELIRQGIDIVLQSADMVSPEEQRKRAISVAGRFQSGVSDLSRKHDKHLAEAFKK